MNCLQVLKILDKNNIKLVQSVSRPLMNIFINKTQAEKLIKWELFMIWSATYVKNKIKLINILVKHQDF